MNTNLTTGEYLQRQLVDMIELAKTTGTNAVEFVSQQAPDVVNQLIKWKLTEAIFSAVWPLLVVLIFSVACTKLTKYIRNQLSQNKNRSADDYIHVIIPVALMIIACPILVHVSINWWLDVIKIGIAPKVYLLEYAAKLIK